MAQKMAVAETSPPATQEFYDVKAREKVHVPLTFVRKVQYPNGRYAFTATYDGRKMTRFCSEDAFRKAQVPEG